MPLFPVPTYTSWQLACMAAIEPIGGPHTESIAENAEMRAELQLRGKDSDEVEEMVTLARTVGKHIRPMVCMDIDDLAYGIDSLAGGGLIDPADKDRLIEFLKAHIDAPREERQAQVIPDGTGPDLNLSYTLGRLVRLILRGR